MAFSPSIKLKLATQVDGFCSICPTNTGVPDGRPASGNAAHIVAESVSFARGRHPMPPHERAMEANGIWLCTNCHTVVDRVNPDDYTVDQLLALKQAAIERVHRRRGQSAQVIVNEYAPPSAYRRSPETLRGSAHFISQHKQLRNLLRNAIWDGAPEISNEIERHFTMLSNVPHTVGVRPADLADVRNFCNDAELLSHMRGVEQTVNAMVKSPSEWQSTRPLNPLRGQIDAYLAATERLEEVIANARQPPKGEPVPYVPFPR